MAGQIRPNERKLVAGILGIVLGTFGAHKFYLGYTSEAVIMLCVSICSIVLFAVSCGLLFPLMFAPFAIQIIGLIEGITYLTKTDEDFEQIYMIGHKGWF